jgi:hypothetical protein
MWPRFLRVGGGRESRRHQLGSAVGWMEFHAPLFSEGGNQGLFKHAPLLPSDRRQRAWHEKKTKSLEHGTPKTSVAK